MEEAFDNLGKVAEYQTSVAEIERLTGLNFGVLRDHDTLPAGTEGAEAIERRPITGFEEIGLDIADQNVAEVIRPPPKGIGST